MPLYEYECEVCKKQIEVMKKISDPNPVCCNKDMKKKISLCSFVLNGSGWYRDGYSYKKDNKK